MDNSFATAVGIVVMVLLVIVTILLSLLGIGAFYSNNKINLIQKINTSTSVLALISFGYLLFNLTTVIKDKNFSSSVSFSGVTLSGINANIDGSYTTWINNIN